MAACGGQTAPPTPGTPAVEPPPATPSTDSGTPAARVAGSPVAASQVRFAWADVGFPNPFRVATSGPGGAVLLSLIYDTLVWKDDRGLIPWLAKSWSASPDGRVYTFTIVPKATWHDGTPVSAEDVAFSFAYYARFPYRWMSSSVVDRAEAIGAEQVRITLKEPYAPFLEDIAGVLPIVPKHIWGAVADPVKFDGTGATVGSGPFRFAEYRPAEGAYRLEPNPAYFRGRVRAAEFQQLNVPAETRLPALQRGELELVQSVDGSVADLLKESARARVFESQPFSIVRLAVNTQKPPLDRKEVRQALMLALDRAKIAELRTRAAPLVGHAGVIPPESPWHNPNVATYPYDPGRARTLLGGQSITVELLADPSAREPELMQPMLQAVGVTLNVKKVDASTRNQLLRAGSFHLGLTSHIGVGGDPDYLRRWYAGEETNDFAQGSIFADPEFARLGKEQAAAVDPARRRDIVFRMQEILAEQLPTLVLYHRRFYWAYDSAAFTPMATWGGLMNGIPLPQNKLTFLQP